MFTHWTQRVEQANDVPIGMRSQTLNFTDWTQSIEQATVVPVVARGQVFQDWDEPTIRFGLRVVPRNGPGENVDVHGFSTFSVIHACSFRKLIWTFLTHPQLLIYRTCWSFLPRIIVLERPDEPEAEPEANNQRIAYTLRFW